MTTKDREVDELVLCKDDFGDSLAKVLGETLLTLFKAGYVVIAYDDEPDMGIIVIKYAYKDPEYGEPVACWIDPEDLEFFESIEDTPEGVCEREDD